MTRFFINRPTFALVIYLVLLIGGLFGLKNLPMDLLPKFSLPSISIVVPYPGASPEDVEKNVVDVLERNLMILENIDHINSSSQQNLGIITITFKYGTDIDKAAMDVRDRLSFISSQLPEDAEDPIIYKFDIQEFPVIVATVNSTEEGFELREWADDFLVDELQRVEGVGAVMVWGGGKKRRINVYVHRDKLESYGLKFENIVDLLRLQGMDIPAGEVKYSDKDINLRIHSSI